MKADRKKKVGSRHFLWTLAVFKPRMSTGENWSEKKIFHSRCALETIEEDIIEEEGSMLNSKPCSMSRLLAQLLLIRREFMT